MGSRIWFVSPCVKEHPPLAAAATDTQETLVTSIMDVASPPSTRKPEHSSPEASSEKLRADYQNRCLKTATKKMGEDDDDDGDFPSCPHSPYNPYPPSPSKPKSPKLARGLHSGQQGASTKITIN